MGSEMCIRDSLWLVYPASCCAAVLGIAAALFALVTHADASLVLPCLLYTSDAADERSSVDLGGRRII